MVERQIKGLCLGLVLFLGACASNTPGPAPITRGASAGACGDHITVRAGDTLSAIARRCGHSVPSLAGANALTPPYDLAAGQRLNMPAATPSALASTASSARQVSSGQFSSGHYEVQRGDNLFRIAMAHGMTTEQLAGLNGLSQPYTIHPGQQLRVNGSTQSVQQAPRQLASNAGPSTSGSNLSALRTSHGTPAAQPTSAPRRPPIGPGPTPPPPSLNFAWPVDEGRVVSNFRAGDTRIDGIRIASTFGSPVRAAAAGQVVYAGNEVPGYGQLVLIRHASNWVTAYALNSNLRVSKNDEVTAGQHIADVGRASTDGDPLLHFEIRRGVSPVDPIEHLPERGSAS